MRKIALLILALAIGAPIWAAGTCTVSDVTSTQIASQSNRIADAQTVIVTLTCTGDASTGSFPSTTVPLSGSYPTSLLNTYNLTGYLLYQVGRTPGATQPTANYSVTITDAQGFAIDLGLLTSNGSATAAQMTAITNGTSGSPVVRSALAVAITGNSVASANITLNLIFRLWPLTAASSGSNAQIVASQALTTSPPTTATLLYTTPSGSAGVYRMCGTTLITAAGSAGSVFPAMTYTSSGHTQTGANMGAGLVSVTTQWNVTGGCTAFSADAGTNIYAWLSLGGVSGSPTYLYSTTLERVQ